jgi:truncated hemoglobin YjbI
MKVLLISANTETINMPVFPLGLASVAQAVIAAGHRTAWLDLMGKSDIRIVIEAEKIQDWLVDTVRERAKKHSNWIM